MKRLALVLGFVLWAGAAFGQVYPNHSIPLGQGSGYGNFKFLAPSATAGTILKNNPGADPSWSTLGQVSGTTTNDDASTGNVGEYIQGSVNFASPVTLVTATDKTITSIVLTAGDWDVRAVATFNPANTTSTTSHQASISSVTNALDTTTGRVVATGLTAATVHNGFFIKTLEIPSVRFSLTAPLTVYLVESAVFTVAGQTGWGIISARRIR